MSEKKKDFLIVILIFFLTLIFFWKFTALRVVLFGGDATFQHYPQRVYAASMIKKGIFPLWTPDIFCGFPLFAEGQTGILYPLFFLFLILPGFIAYNYFIILHFFLAGLFMYLLMRVLGTDRFSCVFASLFFMFSAWFLNDIEHLNRFNPEVWLPLIFYFVVLAERRDSFIHDLSAGLVLGIVFLAGHPQSSFHNLIALSAYFIFKAVIVSKEPERLKKISHFSFRFLSIVFVGMGLAAIQLIPTYELTRLSVRSGGLSYEDFVYNSVSPAVALQALLHFNTGVKGNLGVYPDYLGLLPFILVLIVLVYRRSKTILLLVIFSLLMLMLSMGEYFPLYRLLYYIPVFNWFRFPDKYVFLSTFSLSILSGFGLNFIINKAKMKLTTFSISIIASFFVGSILFGLWSHSQKEVLFYFADFCPFLLKGMGLTLLILILILGLLLLFLQQKITSKSFKVLFILLVGFTLYLNFLSFWAASPCFESKSNIAKLLREHYIEEEVKERVILVSPEVYQDRPGFIKFLKKDKDTFRTYDLGGPLRPNVGLQYEISSNLGYTPLVLDRWRKFPGGKGNLIFLSNAKYITTLEEIERKDFKLVYDKEIKVYKYVDWFPRAFIVHKMEIVGSEKEYLIRLSSKDFDPRETVILEEEPPPRFQIPNPKSQTNPKSKIQNSKFEAQIVKYSSQEVIIEAELKKAGFLVLTDTYYPGWEVYIDGKRDKIYQADYLFRAVFLKKGNHIIRFIYDPLSFKIGRGISIATLFLVLMTIIYLSFGKRKV